MLNNKIIYSNKDKDKIDKKIYTQQIIIKP